MSPWAIKPSGHRVIAPFKSKSHKRQITKRLDRPMARCLDYPMHLTASQLARVERLLKAGFKFITFEQFARYPAAEKEGFVALLDLSGEKVRQFGSMGYHLGGSIGVLIERAEGQAFVWKDLSVAATPELLAKYARVRKELDELLKD
jgi:hypothetical protein